jgi:hypothetical protein
MQTSSSKPQFYFLPSISFHYYSSYLRASFHENRQGGKMTEKKTMLKIALLFHEQNAV